MVRTCHLVVAILLTQFGCTDRQTKNAAYDVNKDGANDLYYEPAESGYYEIRDRNFDGRMDESTLFNTTDQPVTSRSDNDYDGVMETATVFSSYVPPKIVCRFRPKRFVRHGFYIQKRPCCLGTTF